MLFNIKPQNYFSQKIKPKISSRQTIGNSRFCYLLFTYLLFASRSSTIFDTARNVSNTPPPRAAAPSWNGNCPLGSTTARPRTEVAGRWADRCMFGLTGEIRRAHAAHYLRLAHAATAPGLTASGQAVWRTTLETDHDNLRAALRFSLDAGDPITALELCAVLWRFWFEAGSRCRGPNRRGSGREARRERAHRPCAPPLDLSQARSAHAKRCNALCARARPLMRCLTPLRVFAPEVGGRRVRPRERLRHLPYGLPVKR